MNKKILILLIILITISTLIVLSITIFQKGDDKYHNKIVLKDDTFGITTFTYEEGQIFTIDEYSKIKPVELNITNEDDNYNLHIYHINTSIEGYKTSKSNRKKSNSFKEYTWNNFKGYTYNGSKDNINFIILLKENKNDSVGLFGTLKCTNKNTVEFFKSEQFQKLLNTISYNETIEKN